jgi:di/tricarboxylate transporter
MEFTADIAVVLAILAVTFALFIREVLPPDIVALLAVVALLAAGVAEPQTALAGFANPAVHTIAGMFVISAALLRTGVVDRVGRRMVRMAARRPGRVLLVTLLAVAALSAFVNNTPIVVMMIPVVLRIAAASGTPASKLLIPLSYASILGGCCTLIGTSTNLVVSGLLLQGGMAPLGMFEMAPVGLALAAAGILYLLSVGHRLLPAHDAVTATVSGGRIREYLTELLVRPASPLAGLRLEESPVLAGGRLKVLELVRDEEIFWPPYGPLEIREGDILIARGAASDILEASRGTGVDLIPDLRPDEPAGERRALTLAEVIVTPGSRPVGSSIAESLLTRRFGLSVLAIRRNEHHIMRKLSETRFRAGDILLVEGTAAGVEQLRGEEGFLLLEGVEDTIVRHHRAPLAAGIALAVVLAATFTPLAVVTCALAGAALMVLTGCLTARQIYDGLDARTLVLVAGMIGVGLTAEATGAIAWIAHHVFPVVKPLGPYGILAGVFLLTNFLTEFLSNAASAVLVFPLAVSIAEEAGLSPRPFALVVAFAASLSFSTPVGYQTNTIVYGAGGYRFGDFTKVGLPLNFLLGALTVVLVPFVWPF